MAYTTIDNPELYFNTVTYVANQTDDRQITVGFQPDWTWLKDRDQAVNHDLYDSVRGATKYISSNKTNAEGTQTDGLKSFNSTGFTLGTGWGNQSTGDDYVSWNWKESATAGFDIVSYTGNSSDGVTQQNISHSLSAVPQVIIIKNRADATNWCVYHHKNTSAPETEIIYLNLTNATSDDSAFFGDTAPTSSIFTVGGDNGVNGNGDSMIAYCFAEKKGYSKFGSYVGNGSTSGTYVHLGFKPAFVIIKDVSGARSWIMLDNKRNTFNVVNNRLFPDSTDAQNTSVDALDFTAQGFKIRSTNTSVNVSGNTYIYMCFAESPFVTSTGIPTTAR
jgi:hypothetical protein